MIDVDHNLFQLSAHVFSMEHGTATTNIIDCLSTDYSRATEEFLFIGQLDDMCLIVSFCRISARVRVRSGAAATTTRSGPLIARVESSVFSRRYA